MSAPISIQAKIEGGTCINKKRVEDGKLGIWGIIEGGIESFLCFPFQGGTHV